MNADVLLIRPPIKEFLPSRWPQTIHRIDRSFPIGLAYLAGALRNNGISVKIFDALSYPYLKRTTIPSELRYLNKLKDIHYCNEPFYFFHQGMPDSQIKDFLKLNHFPVVGISSMFSSYHPDAMYWAKVVKKIMPKTKVVMGGSATTASAEMTLANPNVDFIVLGEAEHSFPQLVQAILKGDQAKIHSIPGVGFKNGLQTTLVQRENFIETLDSLPRPAYDLVDLSCYRVPNGSRMESYVSLFTSRGCPHRCDFCTIYISMGRRFRVHSPERVLDEIRHCHDRYGVRRFQIEDDNFAFDPERAKTILRLVIKEFGPRKLSFRNHNGMTALSLRDKELISLMANAGFERILIGLESQDEEVRKVMHKPGTVDHFLDAAKTCDQAGILVDTTIILGLPYSTLEKDIATSVFCATHPLRSVPHIFYYPVPTTPQYESCIQKGWIRPEARFMRRLRSAAFVASRPGYSRRDAFTLFNLSTILGPFKEFAFEYLSENEKISIFELFDRHRRSHPFKLIEKFPGSFSLVTTGEKTCECDLLFAQIQILIERKCLTRLANSVNNIHLERVHFSKRTVRLFLKKLRQNQILLPDGKSIFF